MSCTMLFLNILVAVFPALASAANNDLVFLFQQASHQWSPDTHIYYPGEMDYKEETTQRWSTYQAPTYQVSIKPGTEDDVQKVVSLL